MIDKIHAIIGVDDVFKAPTRLIDILLSGKEEREKMFVQFLNLFNHNLEADFWHEYFQQEMAQRKDLKQDFTPNSVSQLATQLTGNSQVDGAYFEAAAGTGGMMIAKWNDNKKWVFICEELSERAFPFLVFNMAIRGIEGVAIRGNSLTKECFEVLKLCNDGRFSNIVQAQNNENELADTVIMNPPYSAQWSAADKFLSDPRFERYGKLAPKSKADFAFLLHGFYHLKDNGTMGIVLPHGVLFRGAAEGVIRKTLLEMGAIDAVIGLPPNIFYGTSIPTVVLILKKNRQNRNVLFIDASNDFEKQKNQNTLRPQDIAKIIDAYKKRESIERYAHVANYDEIVANDYNLNIPRYVDTFDEEEPIDIVALSREITDLNLQIKQNETDFGGLLDQLAITGETREIVEATKRIFV